MPKSKKNSPAPVHAIEVCHSDLHFVRAVPDAGGEGVDVQTRRIAWRDRSTSIHSELGIRELTAALRKLAGQQRLAGQRVHLTLNGDFCVTRVVTGGEDDVARELAQLEERSALYLSLGPGQKALAVCIHQVDARHRHALLTVTNKKTLDALVQVARDAGVELALIEPSMVALSRAVGHMRGDNDAPVLILSLTERAVELGISYRGQLFLDYRPGGRAAKEEAATTVIGHFARLERYCQRLFRQGSGSLNRVLLCGPSEAVAAAQKGFSRQDRLVVEVFDPTRIDPAWRFADAADAEGNAALGTCLLGLDPTRQPRGPNLMERLQAQRRERLLPAMAKALWPVAAILLVAASVAGASLYERSRCEALRAPLAELDSAAGRVRQIELELTRAAVKKTHLLAVRDGVDRPAWHALLTSIAQCISPGAWLEKLAVDTTGRITISGCGHSDDAVYELVGWLRQLPELDGITLEGSRAAAGRGDRQVKFDVRGNYVGGGAAEGETDHAD